jgi:phosphatidate phosphatase APP1
MKGAFLLLALSLAVARAAVHSDERVVFFPGLASEGGEGWQLSIFGWVHEPERRPVLGGLLRRAIGIDRDKLSDAEQEIYRERTRYFLPDNERGKRIIVQVGSAQRLAPRTSPDGHFTLKWSLTRAEFSALAVSNRAVAVQAILDANDSRAFVGSIHVLSNAGLSVVSDVDDTIKISEVRDRDALLLNTFCRPFRAVEGMAELYRTWHTNGAQFHYLSASPWQLYLPLDEFIDAAGFPTGTFHMKDFRAKDSTFLALFSDPERFKLGLLRPLFEQFPGRRFILVGDSGEKDPEVYGAIAREFPRQVQGILIRNVTKERMGDERYVRAFRGVPEATWEVFESPGSINLRF